MAQSKEQLKEAIEKAKELELKAKLKRQKKEQLLKEREKQDKRKEALAKRKQDTRSKIATGGAIIKALGRHLSEQENLEVIDWLTKERSNANGTFTYAQALLRELDKHRN